MAGGPDLASLDELVREIAADLGRGTPLATEDVDPLLRTWAAMLLALTYLAVFTGRAELAAEQEHGWRQVAAGDGERAPNASALERDTARGMTTLGEFTRRWPARPPAHSTAAQRVAGLYEALGVPADDAARRAMHVADLVNEHVFRPYWRG